MSAETLVFVGANVMSTPGLRSGCTTLLMCEDRNLQPHAPLASPAVCRREANHCGREARHCQPVSACGFASPLSPIGAA